MISDEDLLLYYYRDGLDDAERTRIATALAGDAELAQRLHKMVARLDAAAAQPEVPVPAATQQRWQAALERAAQADGKVTELPVVSRRRPRWFDGRFLAIAAAVGVIALVTVLQFTGKPDAKPTQVADTPSPMPNNPAEASTYERSLKFHLASTERQLASLESATPEQRARLVEDILTQNRMFALAAERAGEPQLARVLRAFGPVLENVAQGGSESAADISQLEFELRVMQGRLGAGARSNTTSL